MATRIRSPAWKRGLSDPLLRWKKIGSSTWKKKRSCDFFAEMHCALCREKEKKNHPSNSKEKRKRKRGGGGGESTLPLHLKGGKLAKNISFIQP